MPTKIITIIKRVERRSKCLMCLACASKYWILFSMSWYITACSNHLPVEEEIRLAKTAKINAQLGIAYLVRHNEKRAKEKLLLALKEGPDIPECLYSMAYFFESTGDLKKANEFYLKSLKAAPEQGEVHNNYGTYLCRRGHYMQAIQHFLIAANEISYLNPADAYENAGICSRKMHANRAAEIYFERALQQDPSRSVSIINLAELAYRKKEYTTARGLLNRFLLKSHPTKQSTHLSALLREAMNSSSSLHDDARDKIKQSKV